MKNIKKFFDKKTITTIIVSVVATIVIVLGISNFTGSEVLFNNRLSDGSYKSEETYNDKYITLDVDGDTAVITAFGWSETGRIDKAKKQIVFDDEDETARYKLVAGKLILTISGHSVPLVREEQSTTKKNETKDNEEVSEVSETKENETHELSVKVVEAEAEKAIGVSPKQATDILDDLQYSEYEDSDISISTNFENEEGDYVSSFEKGYRVTKVLNVVKKSDGYIDVTFIVEKQ